MADLDALDVGDRIERSGSSFEGDAQVPGARLRCFSCSTLPPSVTTPAFTSTVRAPPLSTAPF